MSARELGGLTRAGIVWTGATFVGAKAVTFLSTLVLARLLAPEQFGVVAAVLVFLSLIEIVSDLGMKATVVFEQESGISKRVHTAFTLNLLLALALTAAALLLAPTAAAFFSLEAEVDLFRLGALSILLTGLGNIHDALLLRDMAFRRRLVPELIRGVVRGVVSIALALSGLGALSLVVGVLAGTMAWTVVLWTMSAFRPRLTLDRSVVRSMTGYGFGATLLEAVSALAQRADQLAIGYALGARSLGLYTVAARVPELVISNVAWSVSSVAFPALSRRRALDSSGLANATLTLVRYQTLYAMPIATGLAVLASPLVIVLFSSAWAEAAGVMAALSVRTALAAINYPLGDVFKALGRQRTLVILNILQIPLLAAMIFAAITQGIVAAAWALVVAELAHLGMVVALVTRLTDIRVRHVAEATLPALVASAGVVAGAGSVSLLWQGASIAPVLAATFAGALCAICALRVLAPSAFRALLGQLAAVRQRPSEPAAK